MWKRPRLHPVHYFVQILKDGTIVACHTDRRPYPKRGEPKPYIDEDGCFGWFEADGSHPANGTDSQRVILMLSMVNRLNTKKLLRKQVEQRLERLEKKVDALAESVAILVQRS